MAQGRGLPVHRLDKRCCRCFEQHRKELAEYEAELEAFKVKKRSAKEAGTDPGEPPERPLVRRLVCGDTTIEKLAELLEDNPGAAFVDPRRANGWLASFTRYKDSTDVAVVERTPPCSRLPEDAEDEQP